MSKIFKVKGYLHFDTRKKDYWSYVNTIKDSKWIEKHAFYPFIHYEKEKIKFNGTELIKKPPRDIRYSSHIDRYIYEYYNYILSEKYNTFAKNNGINKVAIAYRNNLNKSNIDFSYEVFKFLNEQESAFILVSDFKSFFDSLNHKYLKEKLKQVLNVETLPIEYYKIFKNVTKYSYIEYTDILKMLNMTHKELINTKKEKIIDNPIDFRKFKNETVKRNNNNYGIVQGSAISATLANVYMIDIDKQINNLITTNNGIYKRYSDDIIIIIPNISKANQIYKEIMQLIIQIPNLNLSEDKTKCFVKNNNKINQIDLKTWKYCKYNTVINYLGFSYDGEKTKITEKAVSKYYRKMYSRIKTINRWSDIRKINIGRRKIYKQYSYLGKNKPSGNFLSYVDRSNLVYNNLGDFNSQVKHSWKYMSKKLKKIK